MANSGMRACHDMGGTQAVTQSPRGDGGPRVLTGDEGLALRGRSALERPSLWGGAPTFTIRQSQTSLNLT